MQSSLLYLAFSRQNNVWRPDGSKWMGHVQMQCTEESLIYRRMILSLLLQLQNILLLVHIARCSEDDYGGSRRIYMDCLTLTVISFWFFKVSMSQNKTASNFLLCIRATGTMQQPQYSKLVRYLANTLSFAIPLSKSLPSIL